MFGFGFQLEGVDVDPGVVVHLAHRLVFVPWRPTSATSSTPPRSGLLRGLLLGSRRPLPLSTATSAAARGVRGGNHALGALPRSARRARRQIRRASRRVRRGRPGAAVRPAFSSAPAAATAAALAVGAPPKLSIGPPINSTALMPESTMYFERGFRALIRHAAVAVGDRADLHAVDRASSASPGQTRRRSTPSSRARPPRVDPPARAFPFHVAYKNTVLLPGLSATRSWWGLTPVAGYRYRARYRGQTPVGRLLYNWQ